MPNISDPWSSWYYEHGAAMMLFARQWVGSQADAEDVVQEAFVRFWKTQHRVDQPLAYLYTCVKHCALDWHRGAQRRSRREQDAARQETQPLFASPVEADERRISIERALLQLPENQREVVVMRVWGGLSFPHIATALQIPENTAASRYRYALAKLREQLAEESIP